MSQAQPARGSRGGRRSPSPVLIGVLFAVATAFGGATLGVVADWINGGAVRPWLVLTFFALFVSTLLIGVLLWRRRERSRQVFGTAYLIEELGSRWTPAETRAFRERVRAQFAVVLEVPGPCALDGWEWPLDDGAKQWSLKLDELVKAFLVVRGNDDELTANGLFVNAHYPVALALGARLVTARRDMPLGVRQRPSAGGRSGQIQTGYSDSRGTRRLHAAHSFELSDPVEDLETAYPGATLNGQYRWRLNLDVAASIGEGSVACDSYPVILLLRFTAQKWGTLEYAVPGLDGPPPPVAQVTNWADASFISGCVEVREYRLEHPAPSTAGMPAVIPWSAFPAVVRAAVDWIVMQAADCPGRTLFLGTVMPQEVGVGIGIRGPGRRTSEWPESLWPMIWPVGHPTIRNRFVIPNLNLGCRLVEPH